MPRSAFVAILYLNYRNFASQKPFPRSEPQTNHQSRKQSPANVSHSVAAKLAATRIPRTGSLRRVASISLSLPPVWRSVCRMARPRLIASTFLTIPETRL